MLSWLANAWRVPELRRRLLFTAVVLAAYRLGSWMPAPGVDSSQIQNYFNGKGSSVLGLLNLFSGSALSRFSIFALGIMPYVTASIILQLMTVVIPQLEQLQKEGEAGTAKINQYTRYLTVALAAAQSAGYAYLFKRSGALSVNSGRLVLIVVTLTAGCVLLMWLGELITKRGIGNGISLLIFASILTSAPQGINAWINGGPMERLFFPLIAIAIVVAVVFVQEGQRRIPIQYAKRMVGRRQTSGGATYMPLRVNMAGVIPVIFAAALLAFPPTVAQFFPQTQTWINAHFSPASTIEGATGILLNITGGAQIGLFEVNEAAEVVTSAADQNANVIFGAVIDDAMGDSVRVTVIATGFGGSRRRRRAGSSFEAPVPTAPVPGGGFEIPDEALDVPSFLRED
jgi:preprotein translocase SecY subunit